ncbi:MAG: quinone oxidoreductase [Rhodospirillaceae bacterium]|jgi:NADPH2:quinone reductase|nr:quinone oxidoreductase [Rhodospirillaceae bacterium]
MKTRVARIHEYGDPEVIKIETDELPELGPGEVLLKQNAAAIHFADSYMRQGRYFLKPPLPTVLGLEGVGTIAAVGDGVEDYKVGDRAAYLFNVGAYADARIVPAGELFVPPAALDDATVVAAFVRTMTAQYLLRRLYRVQAGETILVHSAAGGMGSLLTQWATRVGAKVIGTVSSPGKFLAAEENGCAHVIDYTKEDFADAVLDITGGAGVPVVYDAVGADTYQGNLRALAPRGWFVNYGHASGPPPIDALELNQKSLIFTKASMKDYMATPEEKAAMMAEVVAAISDGTVKSNITGSYELADVAEAHAALDSRSTTGALVVGFDI